jgi:uncharacterized protein YjiS (DUF1127 family)
VIIRDLEEAMSSMELSFARTGTYRTPNWADLIGYLAEWRRRAHSRRELMMLSDRELADVGLTPCDVHAEANWPFWR